MASKRSKYRIERGTFKDGKVSLSVGDEISLPTKDGDRYVALGDLKPLKPAARKSKAPDCPYGLPPTLEPVDGRDDLVFEAEGDKDEIALGWVLKTAFEASGLTVTQWNAQDGDAIEALISHEIDLLKNARAA